MESPSLLLTKTLTEFNFPLEAAEVGRKAIPEGVYRPNRIAERTSNSLTLLLGRRKICELSQFLALPEDVEKEDEIVAEVLP